MGNQSLGNKKHRTKHISVTQSNPAQSSSEVTDQCQIEVVKNDSLGAQEIVDEVAMRQHAEQALLESEHLSQQASSLLKIQRDLAVTLSANINLPEAIAQIVSTLMSLEGIDGAAVYLVDRPANCLELVAHQGLVQTFFEHLRSVPLDSPIGQTLAAGKVAYANFSGNQRQSIHAPSLDVGLHAGAILPVMHEGQIIASMNLFSHSLDEFPAHILNAIEAIAAQAGGAIGRLQAEEARRATEHRYRNLMDLANDAIFLLDARTGLIVDANQKIQVLLGRSLSELKGLHHTVIYPPDLRQYIDEALRLQMQAGGITLDLILYDSKQQRIPGEISARLIEIDGNSLILAIFHDLSERRQMEAELQASESRYRSVVEGQTELICRWTPDGKITFANQAFRDYFRTLSDELAMPLAASEDLPQIELSLARLSPEDPVCTFEARCRFPNGEMRWLQWTTQASFLTRPVPVEFQAVGRDITERVTANQALQASNEQLKHTLAELEARHHEAILLNKMGDMLQSCLDAKEVYRILVQYAPQLFPSLNGALYIIDPSQKQAEVACRWGKDLKSKLVFPVEQCWALRRGHKHVVYTRQEDQPRPEGYPRKEGYPRQEGRAREAAGSPTRRLLCTHLETLPDSYLCNPLIVFYPENKSDIPSNAQRGTLGLFYLEGGEENMEAFSNLATMVSERIALALANLRLSEALRSQAIRDPLTNLFNRRYMEETLDREVRRAIRKHRSVGIIMVDIDNFKQYNTRFYLDGGDAMLIALGRFLKEHIRSEDVACRYGGDEFVLILPEATLEDTIHRAAFIHEQAKSLVVQHRGQTLGSVTFCLGVAAYPEHASNVENLLHAANVAAFQAKQLGGDDVVVSS